MRYVWGLALLSFVLVCPVSHSAIAAREPAGTRAATLERLKSITEMALPEWRFHPGTLIPGQATALDDSSWSALKVGEEWNTGPAWLRRWVEIPATFGGYEIRGARLRFRVRISGENPVHLTIFFNGVQVVEGNDLDPIVLTEKAQPGEKILLAIKAQVLGGRTGFWTAQLELDGIPGRPDPRTLWAECMSAGVLSESLAEGQAHATRVDAALAAIDWAVLERGDQAGFDRSLRQARKLLQPVNPWLKQYSIRATGNSHIDMAWLWPWTETVEVVRSTFSTVLQLMREFPDFVFTHASAQTYAWMEEKYPRLFEEIRQRVREGRWEPVGGMWVEPDLNMADGESLVRQVLVGKRYFREKFGVDIRTGWNPDSFGYNWQLPQIYKKSGFDFFVTQKIYWNDTTRFPHKLFWWEAPDGSRLLSYFPHGYGNQIDPVAMAGDLAEYAPAMGYPEMMHLYGVGDHGGGPTRSMLETAQRWQVPEALYPRLFLGTAQGFFDGLAEKVDRLNVPVWKNELYLEYHRGVYTSQAATKRNNRRSEELLLNAEKFSSLASLFGRPYAQADLNYAWRKVLFNQFHDILPGSSIAAVYRDTERDYAEVRRIGNEILSGALGELVARIQTGGPGVPVVVFNPLAWARTDVVETEVQLAGPTNEIEVRDPAGLPLLAEIIARQLDTHRLTVRFLAEGIPALGYKVFYLVPVEGARRPATSLVARADALENEFYRVQVDAESGCLTSLFDKTQGREVLAPGACGNLLQTFYDLPREYDAWNIDANFEDQKWDLTKAEGVKLVENGPVRAVLRVVKKFQNSRFVQDITLYPKIPRVDVQMEVDWREKHILLKVAFPVAVQSNFATFEIPFGSIERPTTRRTPEEKAKFEVPALRWADLSDGTHGLSVLNDSKYGYDARDNVLRLTLLRSSAYPDPHADEGFHRFTYSLYPHAGSWREAGTVRRGYELNYRLLPVVAHAHQGSLPPTHSFVQVEPENIVLTAIKKAEDDDSVIFRFYEFAGRESRVSLRLPQPAVHAYETNLMEEVERELPLGVGELVLLVRPYEIKCVKVELAPTATKATRAGGE
ncbi:MAG: alpha-mannosidase [Acidobacteria bacterium]|nr:alpha-mannosidase [Acidobacteriota bacterium]